MTQSDAARRQAIEGLYRDAGQFVFRRCLRMLRNNEEAMDVTQWCFVRAWESGFEPRSLEQSLAWLYRTAGRRCLTLLRDEGNRRRIRREHATELRRGWSPSHEGRVIERELLLRALQNADEAAAEVAMLHYFQGLSMKRVVEVTGMSTATAYRAKSRYSELLRRIASSEPPDMRAIRS